MNPQYEQIISESIIKQKIDLIKDLETRYGKINFVIELIEKNKQRYTCDDINSCFNYLKQAKSKLRKATNTLRNLNMNVPFNNFDREAIADDLMGVECIIAKHRDQFSRNIENRIRNIIFQLSDDEFELWLLETEILSQIDRKNDIKLINLYKTISINEFYKPHMEFLLCNN